MTILGLDASTRSTGYSIIRDSVLIEYGLIRSSKKDPYDRIVEMYNGIKNIIDVYTPDYIFIENVPLSHSVNKLVAEHLLVLQGTIFSLAIQKNCKFITMQPTNWRRLAGIKAKDNKRESQKIASIEKANEQYGFDFKWVDGKTDEKNGFSDICESIMISNAGCVYLNDLEVV